MATAEENTLLARQLFAPAASIVSDANDRRVQLAARIAELQNQQQFQQQQLQQQQTGQVNLENLRTANAQKLSEDTTQREKDVTKQAQDAKDAADLHRQFALSYPVYAKAAETLGEEVNPLSGYDQSWEGLGQLQGDMSSLQERAAKSEQGKAAQGLIAILDQSTDELKNAITARDQVTQITQSDRDSARQQGLTALRTAAANGTIPGLDPKSDKFKAAMDALSKPEPDVHVAGEILGPTGMGIYANGIQQGIQALTNDKDRIARISAASRDVAAAQRGSAEALTKMMGVAANNPRLGNLLAARTPGISALTSQAPTAASGPDTTAVFRQLTGGASPVAPAPAAPAPAPTPTSYGAYQPVADALKGGYNLLSMLGQRGGNPTPAPMASPAPAAAPISTVLRPAPIASPMINSPQSQTEYQNLLRLLQSQPSQQLQAPPQAPATSLTPQPIASIPDNFGLGGP